MYEIKRDNMHLLIFVIILLSISFFIIKSFIIPLIFTGILVYLFHPVYEKMYKVLKNHVITSLISIILIISLLLIPMVFTIFEISNELSVLTGEEFENNLQALSQKLNEKYNINLDFKKEYHEFLIGANQFIRDFLYKIPQFMFNVFVISFFFYYFLKNYEKESYYFTMLFEKKSFKKYNRKIKKLIYGIFYGQIMVRFIQALVGTILLYFIGIKGALLLGFLMFFAAFIPFFGTSLIWGPLLIINLFQGDIQTTVLLLIAGIIISTIDNFLLPYIISEKINIGPVITLISIFGGIEFFGIYGILLGPFFLGLLFVFLDEFILSLNNENLKRYAWTSKEREKYRKLKTDIAKKEYSRMLDKKYEIQDTSGNNVEFRYTFKG